MSQLDLALACQVSSRHLSFLESGRARPSREMVLHLARSLVVPLSAQNALLQAAGFAPVFPASPLQSDALAPLRVVLTQMMEQHAPNPALLCDRHWTVLDATPTARALLAGLTQSEEERFPGLEPENVRKTDASPLLEGNQGSPFPTGGLGAPHGGPVNLVRLLTHSPNASALLGNFAEVVEEMTARIRLETLQAGDDPVLNDLLMSLEAMIEGSPPRMTDPALRPRPPLVPILINTPTGRLQFLSAIAHFGTSDDVTVRDLRLELLFPADDATRDAMAQMAQMP